MNIGVLHKFDVIQSSEEWRELAAPCHNRAALRILDGCLKNGGLYVKLGQGLVSMNHVLPKEYTSTLEILQDQVLHRGKDEVRLEILVKCS